ncbi:MAG: methyltransferase domain-containing protein, partial [Deltaproteobacteria bacterium]|nr:methyltransferase domain-containing protein [Deltaproteobacteria bacterium]
PNPPARYLDLGCGVGSVLLMVSHKLRPKTALGVEAQAQSAAMATRAVAELPEHGVHIDVHHADFRELDFGNERYDLITGSPPYFPLGAGVLPDDPQRRACRFEERGGVEVYVATAARAMGEQSRLYIVFQTRWSERVTNSAACHHLHLSGRKSHQLGCLPPSASQRSSGLLDARRQPRAVPYRFRVFTTASGNSSSLPVRGAGRRWSRKPRVSTSSLGAWCRRSPWLKRDCQPSATFTSSLPMFSPLNSMLTVRQASSRPSTMVS